MKGENEMEIKSAITSEEIDRCIAVLAHLGEDTEQIFELPKEQRTELLKVAGMFSRPDRDKFYRRIKDGKKATKRKQEAKDKTARKITGIRSAREAVIFVAPKLLPKDSPEATGIISVSSASYNKLLLFVN